MEDPMNEPIGVPARAMIVVARALEETSTLLMDTPTETSTKRLTALAYVTEAASTAHREASDYWEEREQRKKFAKAVRACLTRLQDVPGYDHARREPHAVHDVPELLRPILSALDAGDDCPDVDEHGILVTT